MTRTATPTVLFGIDLAALDEDAMVVVVQSKADPMRWARFTWDAGWENCEVHAQGMDAVEVAALVQARAHEFTAVDGYNVVDVVDAGFAGLVY